MIKGNTKPNYRLTASRVLSMISEYDIYRKFCPVDFKINKAFSSPLREDHDPSFVIKTAKSGYIYHMDFVVPEDRGNSIQFVEQLYKVDYNTALQIIDKEFGLGILPTTIVKDYKSLIDKYEQPIELKSPPFIAVSPRAFTLEELKYWNEYHINIDECKEYDIYAIKNLYVDGRRMTNPKERIRFAYRYEDEGKELWKIYTPLIKKECGYKWFTNVPGGTMEGLNTIQKDKPCIITKSRKDRIVLAKFMNSVVAAQNESEISVPSNIIERIKEANVDCYIGFDSDDVGKRKAKHYTDYYGIKSIAIPDTIVTENCKDFADMCKLYGPNSLKNLLIANNLIN